MQRPGRMGATVPTDLLPTMAILRSFCEDEDEDDGIAQLSSFWAPSRSGLSSKNTDAQQDRQSTAEDDAASHTKNKQQRNRERVQ